MKKILLIDDEESVRYAISRYLKKSGFDVIALEDGFKVDRTLEAIDIDIIITDLIMPNVEGLEIIQKLKEKFPSLPIIAISGGGRNMDISILEYAGIFGADVTLPKPINEEKLVQHIKELTV